MTCIGVFFTLSWLDSGQLRGPVLWSSNLRARGGYKKILETFSRYRKRITFFIHGEIAERMPELVQSIYDKGHKIAYYGYSHKTLQELGPEVFKAETEKGRRLLIKITGEVLSSFRAPALDRSLAAAGCLRSVGETARRETHSLHNL